MSVIVVPEVQRVLIFDAGALFGRDAWRTSGTALWPAADTVVLKGFKGGLTRRDMREIAAHFKRAGADRLWAERLEGHALPGGKLIRQTASGLNLWEVSL